MGVGIQMTVDGTGFLLRAMKVFLNWSEVQTSVQNLSIKPSIFGFEQSLSWNLLHRPGLPQTHRAPPASTLSDDIKGVHHHTGVKSS